VERLRADVDPLGGSLGGNMFLNMLKHRPHRRGFTLVEILAVVVIIGIASAVIIPQIGTRDDLRAAAAARILIADLIYAQNLAISSGKGVYIKFDKTANNYSMLTTDGSGHPTVAVMHPLTQLSYVQQFGDVNPAREDSWEQVTIDTVTLDGVDSAYQDEHTVGFDEIGSPYVWCFDVNQRNDLGDGAEILLKAGTHVTKVKIGPATGEITVE
jgi:prepilin-type N-terminal cleavage/methylation domain-containing protein